MKTPLRQEMLVKKRLTENSHLLIFYGQQNITTGCLVYMQKFKTVNNEQLFLLPPSIEDFIPSDHLARVINEVVETIDVTEIEAKYSHFRSKELSSPFTIKAFVLWI
ncbi:MAG: hypothetical protein ACTHJ5_09575 [Ilyomonas sp.]